MSKLVTSDNLKAYNSELAEHLQLLERDKTYSVGDTVKYDGLTLKCTIAGNTDVNKVDYSSIDVGDTIVDGTVTFTVIDPNSMWYEEDKFYMLDDIVVYNDKFYKCITAHTATATFDTTKWSEISAGGGGSSGGGISIWQANTDYEVNDVVIDSNLIWQCAVSHTSTTTFDESKWVCISGGEISNGMEIVPLWEGEIGSFTDSGTATITLSDIYTKYEKFGITVYFSINSYAFVRYFEFNKESITEMLNDMLPVGYGSDTAYVGSINAVDSTTLSIYWQQAKVVRVQGIRKAKPIVSSGMKYETLWEGEAGSLSSSGNTAISLLESYKTYQKLGVIVVFRENSYDFIRYYEVTKEMLTASESNMLPFGYSSSNSYIGVFKATSSNVISIDYVNAKVTKVVGISEGVVVPTGVQAARVTLWEGLYNSTGAGTAQELNDSIFNYDKLEITFDGKSTSTDNNKQTFICNPSDVTAFNRDIFRLSVFANSSSWSSVDILFSDNNHFYSIYYGTTSWSAPYITKIVGIKYIQPDSYSTDEKLIGTWIDGKPLYRKVFTPTGSGTSLTFESGLVGANYNVQKIYGCVLDVVNNILSLPFNDGSTRFTVYISYSTGTVHIETNQTNYTVKSIIVEYTKN